MREPPTDRWAAGDPLPGRGQDDGGVRIVSLHRYPVKGCAGVPVDRLELDEVGPVGDRRWMIAEPSGEFLSQRSHPGMARLRVELVGVAGRQGVRFHAPGEEPLEVAVPPPDAPRLRVSIWGDPVDANLVSADADAWLARALGRPARLLHLPDRRVRPVNESWAVDGFPSRVAFADGFPLTLLSEESVQEVDRRVGPDVHIGPARFRPNVVVAGGGAWIEDTWRRVRLGGVEVAVVKPCARCTVTTVDPATGSRGKEPLRTLAAFRKAGDQVYVAQNALHRTSGVIRVCDPVEVLEAGRPRPGIGLAETYGVVDT